MCFSLLCGPWQNRLTSLLKHSHYAMERLHLFMFDSFYAMISQYARAGPFWPKTKSQFFFSLKIRFTISNFFFLGGGGAEISLNVLQKRGQSACCVRLGKNNFPGCGEGSKQNHFLVLTPAVASECRCYIGIAS